MEKTKFGIYTTFYNCERFVDIVFSNLEKLNYENFEWHMVDDFSQDNTRQMVLDRIEKSSIKDKIKFFDQSEKKEMYWKPNVFFDNTFDWIVLVDSDDLVDPNFLKIYDFYAQKYDDITLMSSEFHKINEDNGSLHSITYLNNNDIISKKINRYHPTIDYLNNTSYSCYGVLRAFKHSVIDEFKIDDMLSCAEDSYHVFWSNSYGKYLHIPRPLYTWTMRDDSESHSKQVPPNFNGNFNIALNKLKSSDFGVNMDFNELYVETCTLSSYNIGDLKGNKVSLWSRFLSENQKQKLIELYQDIDLSFNNLDSDIHVFSLNYMNKKELDNIIPKVSNKKLLFYYLNENYHSNNENMDDETNNKLIEYVSILNKHISFSWWIYIRHFIIKNF
jgi:glycosyltransferase involved in cell wall biosynthesis